MKLSRIIGKRNRAIRQWDVVPAEDKFSKPTDSREFQKRIFAKKRRVSIHSKLESLRLSLLKLLRGARKNCKWRIVQITYKFNILKYTGKGTMYVKLVLPDIKNCLEALREIEEPTESEKRTMEKLAAIQAIQEQRRSDLTETPAEEKTR